MASSLTPSAYSRVMALPAISWQPYSQSWTMAAGV